MHFHQLRFKTDYSALVGLGREGGDRKRKKAECEKVSKGNGLYLPIHGAGTDGINMMQSVFLCLLHFPCLLMLACS